MPYVEQRLRTRLRHFLKHPTTPGELNYMVAMSVIKYVDRNGLNYQVINDVVGALEGVKAEFQRRVVAPYEDRKIAENGDLPWPQ